MQWATGVPASGRVSCRRRCWPAALRRLPLSSTHAGRGDNVRVLAESPSIRFAFLVVASALSEPGTENTKFQRGVFQTARSAPPPGAVADGKAAVLQSLQMPFDCPALTMHHFGDMPSQLGALLIECFPHPLRSLAESFVSPDVCCVLRATLL